eukprot:15153083-Heterocapsa_arctica.AAC.1
MDVYNAIKEFNLGKDVGPYMMSKVNAADASAAYTAFLEFKEAVKASMTSACGAAEAAGRIGGTVMSQPSPLGSRPQTQTS